MFASNIVLMSLLIYLLGFCIDGLYSGYRAWKGETYAWDLTDTGVWILTLILTGACVTWVVKIVASGFSVA